SGTVSLIEIAEAFSKAAKEGNRPARNIIFMAVSGEEEGLWGSSWYSDNPAFPLDKTSADLNIDMIGRIDSGRTKADTTNYVFVIGDDKLSSDLKPISEGVNDQHDKLTLDYKYNDPKDPARIYYRSDHYNFAKKGVPVLFYFGGLHADYHRPGDTPDKINYPLLAKRARFVFYTAWVIANRQEMLKRDIPLP
ncbi:MAG TPA: M28 family peptidase, partial [Flavitalea sp.]|nr:M28 family peptidase [Flavitalea sp.]